LNLAVTSEEKLGLIVGYADSVKAERIETLDVRDKTVMADYLVVCTGNSDVHVRSIADRIDEKMRESKSRARHVEGRDSGWVLLDFGDIVCHVMREEQRQFYDLESLWKTMPKSDSVGE
jgi:ribosome-associated protein